MCGSAHQAARDFIKRFPGMSPSEAIAAGASANAPGLSAAIVERGVQAAKSLLVARTAGCDCQEPRSAPPNAEGARQVASPGVRTNGDAGNLTSDSGQEGQAGPDLLERPYSDAPRIFDAHRLPGSAFGGTMFLGGIKALARVTCGAPIVGWLDCK